MKKSCQKGLFVKDLCTLSQLCGLVVVLLMLVPNYVLAASGLTYTGRILKGDTPVDSGIVRFYVWIQNKNDCVLYGEQRDIDMSGSNGTYSFEIGSAATAANFPHSSYGISAMGDVFDNSKKTTDVDTNKTGCLTYTPAADEGRVMKIQFLPPGEAVPQALPDLAITAVPSAFQAFNANKVGGYGTGELLKVGSTVNQTHGDLTQANYDEFIKLILGTSTTYLKSVPTLGGDISGTLPAVSVDKIKGFSVTTPVAPADNNKFLQFNGTQWVLTPAAAPSVASYTATGTVQFDTDKDTSGIDINGAGLAKVNTGTGANQIVKLDGTSKLPAVDGSQLTNIVASSVADNSISTNKIQNGAVTDSKINDVAWSKVTGKPTTLTGYGITDAVKNNGATPGISAGLDSAKPGSPVAGELYIATDVATIYRWSGAAWTVIATRDGAVGGTAGLTNGKVWIGNGSGVAEEQSISGDATITAGGVLTLKNTGSVGTYTKVITDAQGRVTGNAALVVGDITTALGYTPLNKAGDIMTGNLGLNAVAADPAGLVAGDAGKVWYNTSSNQIKYWNGSAAVPLGAAGSGLQSLNGETGNNQSFGAIDLGTSVLLPTWSSAANVHTLKIPMASDTGVTAGLLSKADHTSFSGKLTSPLTTKGDLLSRDGTTHVRVPVGANNEVLMADSAQASGLKWAALPAAGITDLTGDVTATGPGSAAATIGVGKVTSSHILDGEIIGNDMNFTGVNIATSNIVIKDSTGKFFNFNCSVAGHIATWTVTGWGCQAPATAVVSDKAALASGKVWVGNASGVAQEQSVSGDATIDNAGALTLKNTGTVGTYTKVTTDAQGRVVSGGALAASDVTDALTYTPVNKAGDTMVGNLNMGAGNFLGLGSSAAAGTVAGQIWYNAGKVYYYNGSSAQELGVAGAGITSFNGSTVSTHTLAAPTSAGTTFGWSTNAGTGAHTLNIPLAATATVTAGLVSNADYASMMAKQSNTLTSTKVWIGNASGGAEEQSLGGDIASVTNTGVVTLKNTGTVGTYTKVTTDAQGRVVSGGALSAADVTSALTYTPVNKAGDTMAGDLLMGGNKITGLTNVPNVAANPAVGDNGKSLRWNNGANQWEWFTAAAAGAGITSLNSQSGNSQSFGAIDLGTSVTAPVWSSAADVHTLKIPMASDTGVTAGLLSKADHTSFSGKLTSPLTTKGDVLAHDGTNHVRLPVGTNNQVLTADSTQASGLKWSTLPAAGITDLTGDVTATGPGSAAATIGVGKVTSSHILDGEIIGNDMNFTGVNIATSSIVIKDSTGKFFNFNCSVAGHIATWTVTGWGCQAPATAVVSDTATLASGKIWVGNTSNKAAEVNLSGDATIDNAGALTLKNTGSVGTYYKVVTDAQGRVVSGGALAAGDITGALTYTPVNKAGDTMAGNLNMNSNDITNAGNISMANNKYFTLSNFAGAPGTAPGQIWYDSGKLYYRDATSAKELGVAGAGITSFNGSTVSTQTLAAPGASGNSPNWSTNTGTGAHTLNIPMANTGASVTAGLISNTEYATFNAKQSNALASTKVWIGNSSGGAEAQSLGGDIASITNAGVVTLKNTGTVGTYAKVVTDAQGRVISGSALTAADLPSLADTKIWIGNSSSGAVAYALSGDATMSNIGVVTLSSVGTAGTYTKVITDAKGRVTGNAALNSTDVTTALGYTPANGSGYVAKTGDTMTGALTLPSNGLTVGTNQLAVSGGMVGIGTSSPMNHLAVYSTAANGTYMSIRTPGIAINQSAGINLVTLDGGTDLGTGTDKGWNIGALANAAGGTGKNDLSVDYYNGSSWTTSFTLDSATGYMGLGSVSNPATQLDVSGAVRVGSDASACAAGISGAIRYNATNLQYCDGSSWKTLSSSSGVTSINGSTVSSQTFPVPGTSGNAPAWTINTGAGSHTLNIPMANASGTVTAGLISNADHVSFTGKLTSPLTTKGDILTRDGSTHVRLPVGADNYVLTADSAQASGLKWAALPAGITALTGDITATGPGSVAATIGASKVTSSHILDGTIIGDDMNFTGVNVATSNIVIKDSTGKFFNFNCSVAGHIATWTVTGWACQAPAAPAINNAASLANNKVWIGNASGVAVEQTISGDATLAASGALTLKNTGAVGTYTKVITDAQGRVVNSASMNTADITTALTYTPVNKAGDTMAGNLNMGGFNLTNAGLVSVYKANSDARVNITSDNTSTNTARYPGFKIENYMGSPATGNGGNPSITMVNYRGTSSTSAPIRSAESLGGFVFAGGSDTATSYIEGASIWATATQNFSTTAAGTSLSFMTTANNTITAATRMTIDQSGYVGIGTSSPTTLLSIEKDTNGYTSGYIYNGNTGNAARSQWTVTGSGGAINMTSYGSGFTTSGMAKAYGASIDGAGAGGVGIAASHASGELRLYTGGTADANERVRISSSGNFGIGTTNPAAKLDVVGSAAFQDNSNTTNGAFFSFWKSRNYAAVQLNDVLGYFNYYGSDGSSQQRAAYISSAVDGTVASGSVPGNLGFFTTTAGNADSSERMRITSTGIVGINTTNPGARLDITDTSTTTSAIIVPRAAAFTGTAVNGMIRYNSTNNNFEVRQNGSWVVITTSSDARLKTNVEPVTNGLNIVNQLNPVFYDWDKNNPRTKNYGDKHEVGFIAQDLEKVLPEVVNKGEDTYRTVEYGKIVAVVVAAVKELYQDILGIKSDVANLKAQNEQLKKENAAQAQQLKGMKAYLCKQDPQADICH